MRQRALSAAALAALVMVLVPAALVAQVTTGTITASVKGADGSPRPGARVGAVHEPSGTRYEGRTRPDGRVTMPGLRVGGPYRVTAVSIGFQGQDKRDVQVNLGTSTDLEFVLRESAVQLTTVTITGENETVFSSTRTGAATSVNRSTIEALPSLTRRIEDFARLTPQYSGAGFGFSFAGQDNRLNNVTVDGSVFNNSFGLSGQPGDRTGVAPISLDAIEQVQVSIAPYDVRQGNFVGANVNTVTRSGNNRVRASIYRQWRDQSLIGKEAKSLPFNPGTFEFKNVGGWVSGPIIPNKLFFFFNYEDEASTVPGTTQRANTGSETVAGQVTRVKASDLDALSAYLGTNFAYETGGYQDYPFQVPAKRLLAKVDFNLNTRNKLSVRYNRLDSSTDQLLSNSNSLGGSTSSTTGRRSGTTALNFVNSNYKILENIRSTVGEWNSIIGDNMANNLIVGYTEQDESRGQPSVLFPFVDILEGGTVYTSFGTEPFTPNNELRYHTFQLQDNFTRYADNHTLTFGASGEWYESENVFNSAKQSVYTYNSLADFYADANGYLANPNRTVSPVTLAKFEVRYLNVPGVDKPVQPLKVFYGGIYGQDEWQVTPNLKVTAGLRVDQATFEKTGFRNASADALTFRDENGNAARYATAKLPDPHLLLSPRVGFNWDATGDRTTQFRGGTGIFTGRPPYVWISNQIGQTGVLTGFELISNTTTRPFNPDPDTYKPKTTPTGAPAASYELNLSDPGYRFPQLWRTDLGIDRRLPWGWTGTFEAIYNRDVNGAYYINANLAPANRQFVGPDARPRWVGTNSNRLYSHIANVIVLKNQNDGYSWNLAASLERAFRSGFFMKTAYSYGLAKNTVDPGSTASTSWGGNQHRGDPNNPGMAYSSTSPGHRLFLATSFRKEYFNFGATTLSLFGEARTIGNTSYVFSGDVNGDAGSSNDLLYIHKDVSEMNFQAFTVGSGATARTYTSAEQAAAWNAFIEKDDYLSQHRGEYAQRNAVFLPMVKRVDFSITQEVFANVLGSRNSVQFSANILNFGNFLNKNWGVSQRLVSNTPLIVPSTAQGGPADATGRMQYRMRCATGACTAATQELMTEPLEQTAFISDVFRVLFGIRYNFN